MSMHFNHPSILPPTHTPLLILIPCSLEPVRVERTSHVVSRDRDLEYVTETGIKIIGKYMWTYP